jgi:hypothetical protein
MKKEREKREKEKGREGDRAGRGTFVLGANYTRY